MLTLFSDTVHKSVKDLLSLNAGAVEQYSQQQTELITGLISDHINYASSLTKQRDYKEWVSVSQAYTESVRSRMLKSVNASYTTFSETNEKASKLLKTDAQTPAAKTTKKAAPKPAAKAAVKPVTKVEPAPPVKAEAKPAASKPAAKTTRAKAATTATADVAPAPAKAPAKPKAAATKAKTSTSTRKTTASKTSKAAE